MLKPYIFVFTIPFAALACGSGNVTPDAGGAGSGDAGRHTGECASCYYTPVIGTSNVFDMGCFGDCEAYPEALPSHPVWLFGYLIRTLEVSQGDYQLCIDAGSCTEPLGNYAPIERALFPVTNVDWQQARDYCLWAGADLPTEAEWEYAARQFGTSGHYPWDDDLPLNCDRANYLECRGETDAVSESGVLPSQIPEQMAGNVAEWVLDLYDATYYSQPKPMPDANPTGPTAGDTHVVRGGGFRDTLEDSRTWIRKPGMAGDDLGFRCAIPDD